MPDLEPLLLSAAEAAQLCGISRSAWWGLRAAAKLPQPVHLGRRRLWRRSELEAWIAAGCPTAATWEAEHEART